MKSWQLDNTGKEHLHLIDQPQPTPGPSEVLVRTIALSLNFRDKAIIDGTYPVPATLPLVPGSDLAGEVVAVGPNVRSVKVGDKVASVFKPHWIEGTPTYEANNATLGSPLPGVWAEYVVLPETGVVVYPTYLTPAQASTLPIAAVTAWVALFGHGKLKKEDTVLIQGSGGVSLFALQLAVAHGARVIATSRSASKFDRLKKLGASDVIDTTKFPNWEDEVRRLTGGKGVDHVIEVVGGDAVQHSISASAWGGHIAIIGFMGAMNATISIPWMLGTTVRLEGIGVGSRKDMQDLLAFLETHKIAPIIDATYKFEALPEALEHMDRGPFGKIVIEHQ
jgi:NADPH:quinone reductase-like Zn-dependent oxidoreductase